jgi:hypothetical protein
MLRKFTKNKTFVYAVLSVLGFLILLIVGYNLLYITPILGSRKSLTVAKNLAVNMKMVNSENLLAVKSLITLNPTHPEYTAMLADSVAGLEKTNQDFKEVNKKFESVSFKGTKEVRSYLNNDYSDKFKAVLDTYSKNMVSKTGDIENYKKISSATGRAIGYNPYSDLGSLDLNSDKDREAALQRIQAALEGLKKIYFDVEKLENGNKEKLLTSISLANVFLTDLSKALQSGNIAEATTKREGFIAAYKDVFQSATELTRGTLTGNSITVSISDQEKISKDLDQLIGKIEELQKNLPKDPLSKALQKE